MGFSTAELVDRIDANLRERLDQRRPEARPPLLCLAWSGGRDSTALLDLLDRLESRRRWRLAAIHVDHGLRNEAAADVRFCRRLAARRGIPLQVERLRLAEGGSLEGRARRQRYAALASAAGRLGADAVATAHHADDAVETALLNWTSGTGTEGMANLFADTGGPRPFAGAGPALIRPLRSVPRDDLAAYAEARDLRWRTDSSNADRHATRNRLRQDVLPALLRESEGIGPLRRTLENLADDGDALRRGAERHLRPPKPGLARNSRELRVESLAEAPPAESARALRLAARSLPEPPRWSRRTLRDVLRAVDEVRRDETDRRSVAIGGGAARIEGDTVRVTITRERGGREIDDRRAIPAPIDRTDGAGAIRWFDAELSWRTFARGDDGGSDPPVRDDVAWFDADRIPDRLVVRGPAAGESMLPLGADGRRSLTEILRAGGTRTADRWCHPILAAAEADAPTLWVAGVRQSRRGRIRPATERVFEIRLERR